MLKEKLLRCTCENKDCKYEFTTNSSENLQCPSCGSENVTGEWKNTIIFDKEESKFSIYTLTSIKVDMDEQCEHDTKVYINCENIEDIFQKEVDNWIKDVKEIAEDNGDEFDLESWIGENLKHDINTAHYKCKHFISDDGREKIFELKSHEVTE